MRSIQITSTVLAFGAASLLAGRAGATDCTTLPNPVYVYGSTAFQPVAQQIAAYLAVQTPAITLVYGGAGSCAGVNTIVNAVVTPSKGYVLTPSGKSNYFVYYDNTGAKQACDITLPDGGVGVFPDIATSDVYATSCPGQSTVSLVNLNINERLGPVQAMTFVVPKASTQTAISAEAAYLTYAFGGKTTGVSSPWPDVMSMYQRGPTSGTQAMISKAIGLSTTAWFGLTPSSTCQGMMSLPGTAAMACILDSANTAKNGNAIGILGAADMDILVRQPAVAAGQTPTVHELYYQHFGQNCGYLPDSDVGTFDKRNVRDGHYAIWGPVHVYTLQSSTNPNVSTVVNLFTGFTAAGTLDVIAAEAQNGLIPQCAMRVTRTTEMGPLSVNTSNSAPCSCYYELNVTNAVKPSPCQKCTKTADCTMVTGSSCQTYGPQGAQQGYCEPPL
jgi:hypothetical protein